MIIQIINDHHRLVIHLFNHTRINCFLKRQKKTIIGIIIIKKVLKHEQAPTNISTLYIYIEIFIEKQLILTLHTSSIIFHLIFGCTRHRFHYNVFCVLIVVVVICLVIASHTKMSCSFASILFLFHSYSRCINV